MILLRFGFLFIAAEKLLENKTTSERSFITNYDWEVVQPRLGLNVAKCYPFFINILSLRDIF